MTDRIKIMHRLWVILLVLMRLVFLAGSMGFASVNYPRPTSPIQFDDSLHFKFKKIKKDRGYQQHLYACHDDRDCGPGLVCRSHTYGRFCSLSVPSLK
jgi:hypothetical protein